jgi:hypothetical protein
MPKSTPVTALSNAGRAIEVARALASAESGTGLIPYLRHVVVDAVPEPRAFRDCADEWQWSLAREYAGRLDWLAGIVPQVAKGTPQSFWYTFPRGHDKTGSIGRALNFLLKFSKRSLRMGVAAADAEQAALVLQSMKREQALNENLLSGVSYTRSGADGPGGNLVVLTADAPSAYGLTLDLLLLDELTSWKKRDLFDVLYSGREKRPGMATFFFSNAGVQKSWQEDLWLTAQKDETFRCWSSPPGVWLASWMNREGVDRMRKFLRPAEARRVIDNVWIDPSEESGFVTYSEVAACLDPTLSAESGRPLPGVSYFAGIDYGPKRDRTALAVVHREQDNQIVVDRLDVVQGTPERPVRIETVEKWIDTVAIGLYKAHLIVDPYQMEATIQRYEGHNYVERFEPRGGKSNYALAECLRSLVVHRRLRFGPSHGILVLPDGRIETLADELPRLVLKPTAFGYRIDTQAKTANGQPLFHDDRAVAIGMAALAALRDPTSGQPVKIDQTDKERTERAAEDRMYKGSQGWRLFGMAERSGGSNWREAIGTGVR